MSMKRIAKSTGLSQRLKNRSNYRVVLIHPSAGVNWSGGAESFAIEMARQLGSYFEVELLGGNSGVPHYYPAGGIPRTQARHLMRHPLVYPLIQKFSTHPDIVVEHLTSFIPCVTRLLSRPADLIFPCNSYGGLAMATFVRQFTGTPVLYTEQNGLLGNGKLLARDLKFRPDRLVVLCQAAMDLARQIRPNQPVTVIPNGVDMEKFTPAGERIELGLNKPIALCVASLDRRGHKRVELAIQAIARLPHVSLFICGDGADRTYFQTLGERLLGANRFAIQTFPFDQMPAVYRSADVFTLPSLDEPFGIAYIEAMASGLPVVATNDELRRLIVADAGILCDVTQVDRYAEAIKTVLEMNLSAKARQEAMRFSWNTIAQHYRDLILQMIERSND